MGRGVTLPQCKFIENYLAYFSLLLMKRQLTNDEGHLNCHFAKWVKEFGKILKYPVF